MASYRKGWGSGLMLIATPLEDTSLSLDACYKIERVPGLSVSAQVALDNGSMYGDNFGCLMKLSYSGNFNLGR